MSRPRLYRVLEEKHTVNILLFLYRNEDKRPICKWDVQTAVGNGKTVLKRIAVLEKADLLVCDRSHNRYHPLHLTGAGREIARRLDECDLILGAAPEAEE